MAISGKHSWIENSDVVSLFPTLVWKIQLRPEVHEPIDASALGLMHSLRQGQPELKSGEAWQSGHALHRREELHALCDCVNRAAASVLQFLKIGEPAIEITGCWMNLYAPGAAHRAHSHPNNFLSAVYYVRTAPGADSINFQDPRSQAGVIRPPVTELTAANTDQVVVLVKDGTLLVFPFVSVSLSRCQRQRRDPDKPELQPDVFHVYCCIEQAVVGRRIRQRAYPIPGKRSCVITGSGTNSAHASKRLAGSCRWKRRSAHSPQMISPPR